MNNVGMHQHKKRGGHLRQNYSNIQKAVGEKEKVPQIGHRLLGLLISQNDLGDGVSSDLFSENVAKYSTAKLVLIFDQNVLF